MDHQHDYETLTRLPLSPGARKAGIDEAETRRCSTCGREMTFIKAHGEWTALMDESERSEQDILLA